MTPTISRFNMEYKLIRSKRKTLSLEINENCEVIVRAPLRMSEDFIEKFVIEKRDWIEKSLKKMQKRAENRPKYTENDIKMLKKRAKIIRFERLPYWSQVTGFKPAGVKITSAKKRFGSCSPQNSLCFSLYLFDYPLEAIDYVIVHELCHIKEHNHSPRFWSLVEKTLPDYKERQKLLKS